MKQNESTELEAAPRQKKLAKIFRPFGENRCRFECVSFGVTRDFHNYLFADGSSAHFPRRA